MSARAAAVLAAAAALLVGAAGVAAGWFGAGVVALTVATGIAIVVTGATMHSPAPLPPRPRPRPPAPDPAHVAFDRMYGAVVMAQRGPRWADTSLRPQLTRITDTLLLARFGRGLRDDPADARRTLGDRLYEFLDPNRSPRGHDEGPGLTADELADMIRRLEDLT
jgi:hypothetical protein